MGESGGCCLISGHKEDETRGQNIIFTDGLAFQFTISVFLVIRLSEEVLTLVVVIIFILIFVSDSIPCVDHQLYVIIIFTLFFLSTADNRTDLKTNKVRKDFQTKVILTAALKKSVTEGSTTLNLIH